MSIFDKQFYRVKRCDTCNERVDSTAYATCECHAGQTMTPRGDHKRFMETVRRGKRDRSLRDAVERNRR